MQTMSRGRERVRHRTLLNSGIWNENQLYMCVCANSTMQYTQAMGMTFNGSAHFQFEWDRLCSAVVPLRVFFRFAYCFFLFHLLYAQLSIARAYIICWCVYGNGICVLFVNVDSFGIQINDNTKNWQIRNRATILSVFLLYLIATESDG